MKRIFLALLVITGGYLTLNYKHVAAFPSIISAFYAKEYCSCYFVVGHGEQYCHDYTRQWVPISDFNLDKVQKKVSVTGLFVTTTAQHTGEKTGCRLE